MSADKTIGEDEQTGRRRRSVLTRNRPDEIPEEEDDEVEDRSVTAAKGRATPSRRKLEDEVETSNFLTRSLGSLREYFDGVRSELDKVVWPTRDETQRLTIIVLITLVASAIVLGAISFVFTELFRIGLGAPIILLAVMLVAVVGGLVVYRYNNRRSSY